MSQVWVREFFFPSVAFPPRAPGSLFLAEGAVRACEIRFHVLWLFTCMCSAEATGGMAPVCRARSSSGVFQRVNLHDVAWTCPLSTRVPFLTLSCCSEGTAAPLCGWVSRARSSCCASS